jgi:hypothetical protein
MLAYFERTYLGVVNPSTNQRKSPRYPVSMWNVFERVKDGLPRTNNAAESWHSRIQQELKKHTSFVRVVEFFKLQQSKSENEWLLLSRGDSLTKFNKSQIKKDENIFKLVSNYNKKNWKDHLNGIALNMGSK